MYAEEFKIFHLHSLFLLLFFFFFFSISLWCATINRRKSRTELFTLNSISHTHTYIHRLTCLSQICLSSTTLLLITRERAKKISLHHNPPKDSFNINSFIRRQESNKVLALRVDGTRDERRKGRRGSEDTRGDMKIFTVARLLLLLLLFEAMRKSTREREWEYKSTNVLLVDGT